MTKNYSPYIEFSRADWQRYRQDAPLTLRADELEKLQGQNEAVSMEEVEQIYLPLSRLLSLYVAELQSLYQITTKFLEHPEAKVPYIIGVAGSVGVGKSTTSRILQTLLSRWPSHPRVDLVTTDGFLYSNQILEQKSLMERKGFPESYDLNRLIQFLIELKAGKPNLAVPLYSHHVYDVVPNEFQWVDQPDIVIIEGLNVLQTGAVATANSRIFVSDFFDFSIYVDAETKVIQQWFLDRFKLFRERAKDDAKLFFHQFTKMTEADALAFANEVWTEINEKNLNANILPYRERARLILHKGTDHAVGRVLLRKL